ncbi:hypothetical protein B0H17DRAFT_193630 [Mycena rosella]|uniref:Uncharacterized protein n=1 Tax=Mycena rosella TaxID=1033263 RepID=A0AAD7G6M6_MYCRO|nr:hypothetical protein B0H17DRAFT_193630 [Mycena rosella]
MLVYHAARPTHLSRPPGACASRFEGIFGVAARGGGCGCVRAWGSAARADAGIRMGPGTESHTHATAARTQRREKQTGDKWTSAGAAILPRTALRSSERGSASETSWSQYPLVCGEDVERGIQIRGQVEGTRTRARSRVPSESVHPRDPLDRQRASGHARRRVRMRIGAWGGAPTTPSREERRGIRPWYAAGGVCKRRRSSGVRGDARTAERYGGRAGGGYRGDGARA